MKENQDSQTKKQQTTKPCIRCGEYKPLSQYHKNKKYKDGHDGRCKPCRKQEASQYRSTNKELLRDIRLQKLYDITTVDYNRILVEQKGRCAICEKDSEILHVDHNHNSNEVRGLLCGSCNRGLGLFKDSPNILSKALDYLTDRGSYGS